MRRNVLIILGAVVLAWAALALALGSPTLRLGSGSGSSSASNGSPSPACLPASITHSARLAGTTVAVSPAPGTATADPATQISFLGVPAAQIRDVTVIGKLSGNHRGRLLAYSQGDGASYLPGAHFTAGEQVHVHAVLGRAARTVAFSFHVDTPYPTAAIPVFHNPKAAPADYQSFYTLAGTQAPLLDVTVPDRDPAAGDVLTTNGPGPGQYGPLIYTPAGRLVWFQRLTGGLTAENLNQQTYRGRRVLTWWKGRVLSLGFGQGEDVVMNSRYQTIARVAGGNGLKADLHDFRLTRRNTAYATAYNPIRCDLRSVKGPAGGAIVDTAVQDIDLSSGLVRWEWHSLDHVAAAESEVEVPSDSTPWDYFHLNSIDPEPSGAIFLSARSTWAGYQLDGATGEVSWRLGGNRSSFQMGAGTRVAWQHDGRVLADGEITFFDDGSNPPIHRQSRAVRIALDFRTHRARLTASYTHTDPPLLAASQGNAQTLPDGSTLVGYGGVPAISEYAADGTLLFDAHEPYDMSFYRAFRYPWKARPLTRPAVLASLNNTGEETIVHASWNGATDVGAWRVLAGTGAATLAAQATVKATGFEVSTTLARKFTYAAVQALDSSGHMLAASKPVSVVGYQAALSAAGGAR